MVKVERLGYSFGPFMIMEDLTLEFPTGGITVVLGPSGCGKTTLLNILAGLLTPAQGKVETPGEVSYLFQEPRLLPWLTVSENISLVLLDKIDHRRLWERVALVLAATELSEYAGFYPEALSGGMQQRAAMARAFAYRAPLLLMDEPFNALDIKTRFRLYMDFIRLWEAERQTVVLVTHDPGEAALLGNKIVILSDKPARVIREMTVEVSQSERICRGGRPEVERELVDWLLKSEV